MKKLCEEDIQSKHIIKRLDAVLRLIIEFLMHSDGKKFSIGNVAKILRSIDLSPSEIAKIYGKSSVTDMAPHLYKKKSRKSNV